jgi:hypothetical protein
MDRLRTLDMPIIGFFGGKDQGIPPEKVKEFESNLETVGRDAKIFIYDDASHAFANPSGQRYNKEAAQDAWAKTKAFLAKHLNRALQNLIKSLLPKGFLRKTTFARCKIGAHCTAGMPFAIGIPLGGTLRLTSYCPKDSFGERIRQLAEKSKYVPVFQNPLKVRMKILEPRL